MANQNTTDPVEASVKFIARRVLAPPEPCLEQHQLPTSEVSPDVMASRSGIIPGLEHPFDPGPNVPEIQSHPGIVPRRVSVADHRLPKQRRAASSHHVDGRSTHNNAYPEKSNAAKLHRTKTGVSKAANKRTRTNRGISSGVIERALAMPDTQRHVRNVSVVQQDGSGALGDHQSSAMDQGSEASTERSDMSAALSESSPAPEVTQGGPDGSYGEVEVLLQPQTRPITLDQLMLEVRTIYDGLVMFEDKAIRVDEEHTQLAKLDPKSRKPMTMEDYQSYIALHKAYIHEHHDLHLATQHPAASLSLRGLPAKYSTPARMWRHGIHAPLEILRMRLPESREHMIAFILISFTHMTLFLETVPQFEATWLECIGDLGRYRLALAETEEEREIFAGIARDWYHRAIQINPQVARLYHHCAILASPFSIEQLSLYGRSLTGLIPFLPARKSIAALFRPVLSADEQLTRQFSLTTLTFLRAHALITFGGRGSRTRWNECLSHLRTGVFGGLMADVGKRLADRRKLAAHVAIACSAPIFQYGVTRANGASGSIIRLLLGVNTHLPLESDDKVRTGIGQNRTQPASNTLTANEWATARVTIKASVTLASICLSEALQKPEDEDLLPFIHIMIVMLWGFSKVSSVMQEIGPSIPWHDIAKYLNTFANLASMSAETLAPGFPVNAGGCRHTVPEDSLLPGVVFAREYLSKRLTEESPVDLAEQAIEKDFMTSTRLQRVLWACHKIALGKKWLSYDDKTRKFSAGFSMEGLQLGSDDSDFVPLIPDS